jgi:hypothetical protein
MEPHSTPRRYQASITAILDPTLLLVIGHPTALVVSVPAPTPAAQLLPEELRRIFPVLETGW